jgi:type I restriction enzyme S subunit
MSERALPPGWVWTSIGEITKPVEKVEPKRNPDAGFIYIDISSINNSAFKIVEPKDYLGSEAPSRARQLVHADDVLFSTVRTYLMNIATVPEVYDGQIASTGFSVLRAKDGISAKYLFYYCLTPEFLTPLEKLQRGTSYPAVRDGDVRAQPFPLPPLPEQHRIVAELEKQLTRMEAGVAALRRARARLRRYRAAVLKAACEGCLVPQDPADEPAAALLERILAERRARWEAEQRARGKDPKTLKYPEPAAPDTAGLPELPGGWCWATLEQCFTVQRGRFSVRPRNDPRYYNGMYPFVQIGDLPRDGGNITAYSQTLNEKGFQVSRMFNKGTVLIAIVGATIANTGILNFESCCPDSLVGIQANDETRLRYVEIYLRSKKLEIRSASYASGGQPNINLQTLNPYPVPLPPLAEQQRIVAEVERRLSLVEELEAAVEANLKRAGRLRQALLQRAFEGRLVPQDPSDEPASALLERIRAGRAEREAGGKARRKPAGRRSRRREKPSGQQLRLL